VEHVSNKHRVELSSDITRAIDMQPKSPKCVYCGAPHGTTQDHVPPKSFFPTPKPSNLITVPACWSCNAGSAKDEDLFLATFMFTEAGVTDTGKKLWDQKLHRMYKKNIGLRKLIASSLKKIELTTLAGIYLGRRLAIKPDKIRSERVVNKIVRGLYYHEFKEPLSPSVEIVSHFLQRPSEISYVEKFAPMLLFGSRKWPGVFEYRFNRVVDQPKGSMWVIRFFGKIVFWAVSSPFCSIKS